VFPPWEFDSVSRRRPELGLRSAQVKTWWCGTNLACILRVAAQSPEVVFCGQVVLAGFVTYPRCSVYPGSWGLQSLRFLTAPRSWGGSSQSAPPGVTECLFKADTRMGAHIRCHVSCVHVP